MMTTTWLAALAASAMTMASPPQMAAPAACPAQPAPLPADLAGWSAMTPITAGRDGNAAPALRIGSGVRATLAATPSLRYPRPPAKAGAPDSFGGLFAVTVTQAGRYRVALGGGAWIDMLAGTRALASVGHDHGPACSPVKKMVDFDLAPGRYLVQVAGSRSAALPMLIVRLRR